MMNLIIIRFFCLTVFEQLELKINIKSNFISLALYLQFQIYLNM